MDYFIFRESSNNGWIICPKYDAFGAPAIEGSYALFACRLLGISWPKWLRLCQQNGAKLYGKNHIYVQAIWPRPNKEFLKMLNQRANEVAARVDVKELHW